jgi:hypothetical protein
MVVNPFIPSRLVGRQTELRRVCHILKDDGDLLLAGMPGNGRRTLLRHAAENIGVRIIEIDCLRATDGHRFLKLLAEAMLFTFQKPAEIALIQQWSFSQPFILEQSAGSFRLVWHTVPSDEWNLLQKLLSLPQTLAESLNCRVVIVFLNFPHIRSWDRSQKWENYLRQEIQEQSRVSYALIATVAESWVQHSDLQVVLLGPLADVDLKPWVVDSLAIVGLEIEPAALNLLLGYVQGHMADAIALLRRIWMDHRVTATTLLPHHIHRSTLALVEDLSITFESLIMLLPPSQVRVLESLALDPTDSPHSREYILKHQLSRGGGLQGALASLQQKGLVYGVEYRYQVTLPLLAFWLKSRLG